MKLLSFLTACFLFQALAVSQQINITVNNLGTGRAYLSTLSGEKILPIDSVTSKGNGGLPFNLSPQRKTGIYRLSFDRNKWIDFINDGEDVAIATDTNAIVDGINVIQSESNRLYYSFLKLNKQYKTKSELLQLVLARYPHDDPYYRTTQTTVTQLQKEYSGFVRSASTANPTSFVARYIRSSHLPMVNFNEPFDKQLNYLKAHALDNVDFSDDGLIYSDLFTNKTIEYLTYYRNPQLPKELLEKEFMVAVDTILNKAKVNQVVYKHITEYLIDGFKKFSFEQCISYILDNYVIKDDLCLDEGSGSTIHRMIDQKKYLPVGAAAPDITLPDTSGNPVSLMTMAAEKILVVFYSTSCPHCQTMIPRLSEIAKGRKGSELKVLAISLDGSRAEWLSFIRSNSLTWTNVNEVRGWQGRSTMNYFVYATPTMILVNKERKVIAKPLTIEELQKHL
jgi:thiol-disulfide isomerase/thioredoxin